MSLFSITASDYKNTDGYENSPKSKSLTSRFKSPDFTNITKKTKAIQVNFIFKAPNFSNITKKAKALIQ